MSETQDARTETERRDTDVDTEHSSAGQARPTASA